MGKIEGSWSGMRKFLEEETIAASLRGRVRYNCTTYVGMDGCRVFEIFVDNEVIKRFSWETVNSDLSIKPSENAVFSRRFACFVFQPYVFSLVFALTSRNKGKFFSLRRLPYPAALRKYASLPL